MAKKKIVYTQNPTGYVVIDEFGFNTSVGGIRLISGVNEIEVKKLAESMSLKLFSLNIPMSGAKGGIDSDNIEDFYEFIIKIKPWLTGEKGHSFITGPDIGTSEVDYYEALRRGDMQHLIRPGLLSKESVQFKLPLDNVLTALGAIVCMEELLRRDKETDPLLGRKIALEGFGKVGTGLASILNKRAIIVAISTRYGMIQDPQGLDVDLLLDLQVKYGDELIHHYNTTVQPTEDLFSVNCDILVPGARTGVITEIIANMLVNHRPLIVPVSNAPYSEDGLKILEDAGVLCFPDFIASAGAVIAALAEFAGCSSEQVALDVVTYVQQMQTRDLILEAQACGVLTSIYQVAMRRAQQNRRILLQSADSEISIDEISRSFIKQYGLSRMVK